MSVFRRSLAALALCLGLAPLSQAVAGDPDMLKVLMDQARVLKLDRPVAKVIIGNSNIADATVADARTVVLTGKTFGVTNLVLLDAQGNAVADKRVLVSLDERDNLRVYAQTERKIMSCSPACETYTPGQFGSSSTSTSATSTGQ